MHSKNKKTNEYIQKNEKNRNLWPMLDLLPQWKRSSMLGTNLPNGTDELIQGIIRNYQRKENERNRSQKIMGAEQSKPKQEQEQEMREERERDFERQQREHEELLRNIRNSTDTTNNSSKTPKPWIPNLHIYETIHKIDSYLPIPFSSLNWVGIFFVSLLYLLSLSLILWILYRPFKWIYNFFAWLFGWKKKGQNNKKTWKK